MKRLNSMMVILGVGTMLLGLAYESLNAQPPPPPLQITDAKCVTLLGPGTCAASGSSYCNTIAGCPGSSCGYCNSATPLPNKVCFFNYPGQKCAPNGSPATYCVGPWFQGNCGIVGGVCICDGATLVGTCLSIYALPCN